MTPNDFLKIIQKETLPIEEIPDGWYSCEDLSEQWGVGKSCVQKRIKQGKLLGYVTEKKFIIKKNGTRSIPYYKFHEKEVCKGKNKR